MLALHKACCCPAAHRCLGLLLEVEEQRVQLVWSGALARLLPYVELALQERVDALKQVRVPALNWPALLALRMKLALIHPSKAV